MKSLKFVGGELIVKNNKRFLIMPTLSEKYYNGNAIVNTGSRWKENIKFREHLSKA